MKRTRCLTSNSEFNVPMTAAQWDVVNYIALEEETAKDYPFGVDFDHLTMAMVEDIVTGCGGCIHSDKVLYRECKRVLGLSEKGKKNDMAPYSQTEENMIVEVCPHCDTEIYMRWSIEEDGYVAYCPYCGDTLLLCDECFHRDGNDGDGPCDFNEEKCGCYRCPEGRVLPSRKAELLDNAIAHLTELAGRSEILNTLRCIGFTDYEIKMLLEVEKDD